MPDANAAPRLTKTEHALLEEAARRPHGTLTAWIWSSTPSESRPRGKRAASALHSLVRKGLADGFQAESTSGPDAGGAGRTHTTEFTARITAAGREALRFAAEAEARRLSDAAEPTAWGSGVPSGLLEAAVADVGTIADRPAYGPGGAALEHVDDPDILGPAG